MKSAFAVIATSCLALVSSPLFAGQTSAEHAATPTNRLIVLSDIGADPDDTESMVRLLLYSDEIDIEGLIATTSVWKQSSVSPDLIRAVVRAYTKVQPNLLKHDPRYPSGASIEALIKQGLPDYGMRGVGSGKDSQGSDWIIRELKKDDARPLWVTAWGGVNTLAQALYELRKTETPSDLARLVAKLRVYTISDQDDAGPWIRKNFPKLFYIVDPGGDYGRSTWIGINSVVDGIDNSKISNAWLAHNIQQGHGPLGAAYPDVSWGMEGDTPSWLNLIPNGLSIPDRPDWGGWGGRYVLKTPVVPVTDPKTFLDGKPIPQETRPIWTGTTDTYTPAVHPDYGRSARNGEKSFTGPKVTLWRWRDDFQNDFAARMLWTTRSYDEANHPPHVVLNEPDRITVKSGQSFGVSAEASSDPDGDSLSYYWFQYPEAGTYKGKLDIGVENGAGIWLTAPKVERPETVHLIVRVTDKGSPPLSRYGRVVITILP
ncbi:DUF1593 domain-containing protein [Stakelama sediminis]|uniref:DUF1593 domain-containing protein n=1 Tax=Stakelama sediminis TaxID=463200 RepID=A0A840YYJ0_9SPHN|nr:nucleoside hydrolase-like domain-containing protein [Stakelama sediminis]MBB5718713.1 hypothetical protein [Stakelama sediminis]